MESQLIDKCKFFQMSTENIYSQISNSSLHFESLCTISTHLSRVYKIILSESYIAILPNSSTQKRPICYVQLNADLKFARIVKKKYTKGFKLIYKDNKTLQIFIQFQELAKIWITYLSKCLNQVGFRSIYKIVKKIINSKSARIFEVERLQDKKRFVAKAYSKENLKSKEQRVKSVRGEIQMLRFLSHKNINTYETVLESNTSIYIIIQILNGGNLFDRINSNMGFTISQIKIIMKDLSEAIFYLHQCSIMHRDLKLQNIMLREKDNFQVVIIDFGLAAFTEDQPYIFYKCGTPGYIAPELINMQGNTTIDIACDIYSLGIIFHILLTNKYLFDGENTLQIYKKNKEAKFDPSLSIYSNVDPVALDLLCKMLVGNVKDRIIIQEVLAHQFLQLGQIREKEELSPASTQNQSQESRYLF